MDVHSQPQDGQGWADQAATSGAEESGNQGGDRPLTIDWDAYLPFDAGPGAPPDEVPRKVARDAFERLMASRDDRHQALCRLLAANGITLDGSEESIRQLNRWFTSSVEPDPHDPSRLRPIWYAVVSDIALYLGELMIQSAPHLRWELYTRGKRNVLYQWPVISGFTKAASNYAVSPDKVVAMHAHRALDGIADEDQLLQVLNGVKEIA